MEEQMILPITMTALYITAVALATRLAGWGVEAGASELSQKLTEFFSKANCTLMVAFASLAYTGDLFLALIIGAGWLVWRSPGWGDYWNEELPNREQKIIDVPVSWLKLSPLWADATSMALRGSLFSLPLFILMAFYQANPWLILLAVPMALQAVFYLGSKRILPQGFTIAGELFSGALLGALIAGVV
jgi:hypothetical protein